MPNDLIPSQSDAVNFASLYAYSAGPYKATQKHFKSSCHHGQTTSNQRCIDICNVYTTLFQCCLTMMCPLGCGQMWHTPFYYNFNEVPNSIISKEGNAQKVLQHLKGGNKNPQKKNLCNIFYWFHGFSFVVNNLAMAIF